MASAQQTWNSDSWRWDPYKLVAAPAGEASGVTKKSPDVPAEVSTSGSDEQGDNVGIKRNSRSDGPVMCQVDGCLTDLTGLKEYHNRYKICQYHLKIPSIVREGSKQRFCQQCGRFHNLNEFDGDKRSCRARLQRHNARRRKKGESEPPKVIRKHPRAERGSTSLGTAPSFSHGATSDDYVTGNSDSLPSSPQRSQQPPNVKQFTDNKLAADWQSMNTSAGLALDNAFSDFLAQESCYAFQNFQSGTSMDDFVPSMNHDDSTLTNEVRLSCLWDYIIAVFETLSAQSAQLEACVLAWLVNCPLTLSLSQQPCIFCLQQCVLGCDKCTYFGHS